MLPLPTKTSCDRERRWRVTLSLSRSVISMTGQLSLPALIHSIGTFVSKRIEHFGFHRLQDAELRLYIPMADVNKLFADLGMA